MTRRVRHKAKSAIGPWNCDRAQRPAADPFADCASGKDVLPRYCTGYRNVNSPIAPGKYTLSLQADGKTGVNEYKNSRSGFRRSDFGLSTGSQQDSCPILEIAPDQFASPNTEPLSQPKRLSRVQREPLKSLEPEFPISTPFPNHTTAALSRQRQIALAGCLASTAPFAT